MALDKYSREDAERTCVLADKIVAAIEEMDCTYLDVMRALNLVKENYEKKGHNLLDRVSIQKVAAFEGMLD